MAPFRHHIAHVNGFVRVVLEGEVDLSVETDLHACLLQALKTSAPVVEVDLAGVDFMDCAGIRVLTDVYRIAEAQDRVLTITGARDTALQVLELTDSLSLLTSENRNLAENPGRSSESQAEERWT